MYDSDVIGLRRFAFLLFAPLIFQLGLAANAVACVSERGSSATAIDMAGMNMPGLQSHGDHHNPARSKHVPCNQPWGPTGCQPLAACAPGAIVPIQVALHPSAHAAHAVDVLVVLAPPSRTTPPELPPPRA